MAMELSIIMPSLNVADYIEECMDSVLHQTLEQVEILCIDAGSEDGTWEILKKYEALSDANRKIRVIHSDVKSYGYQVNLGIRLSRGKYIAILETDDMVDNQMYEYLVSLADTYHLDFVKADYDQFYTLRNGERYYEKIERWNKECNQYNMVCNPSNDEYFYVCDYNIWAGIYNKSFLMRNNIWLNETKGAAYQDIGFAQQVLACAERAYYSDRSFYRYRIDREMSSINSMYCLQYSRQEFARLLLEPELYSKLVCIQGLYRHMATSFIGEYRKMLLSVGYDTDSMHVKNDYEWFRITLLDAVGQSKFDLSKLPDSFREELLLALNDCKEYASKIQKQEEKYKGKMNAFLRKIGSRDVIVFGAGNRGNMVIRKLLQSRIKPISVYDNNEAIWGKHICDVTISKPEKPESNNVLVVIANKFNKAEMAKQLIDMGTPQNQIIFWEV